MLALRLLFSNLDNFRRRFALVFVAGLLDGIVSFFIPLLLAEYTKKIFSPETLSTLILSLIGLYLTSLVLQWIIRRYGESLGPQYAIHLRRKFFTQVEGLPIDRLANFHSGYILTLINRVSDGLGGLTVEIFWGVAKSISNITLFFYFTARESVGIASLNFVILVIFVAFSTFLSKRMVPLVGDYNLSVAGLIGRYSDFMSNVLTVKKLGIYPFADSYLEMHTADNSKKITRLQNFHAGRWFALHFLFGAAFLSTISFLLFQISKGENSPAVLILFIATYALVRGNVERLSEDFKTVIELNTYISGLSAVIDNPATPSGRELDSRFSELRCQDLEFKHSGSSKLIIVPEFSVRAGEKILITGVSGEGKTTFLQLLSNFYKPSSGTRTVNGISYSELSPVVFRDLMVTLSQEVELFNMSLRENILLGRNMEDESVLETLKELDLYDWVMGLEHGLDSQVGEKGIKISAGQKQRINLMRGLLLDREICLLDEPTSHLDVHTEQKLVKFLERRLVGKTAVIISHREALRKVCNRSYRMENGRLIAD